MWSVTLPTAAGVAAWEHELGHLPSLAVAFANGGGGCRANFSSCWFYFLLYKSCLPGQQLGCGDTFDCTCSAGKTCNRQ